MPVAVTYPGVYIEEIPSGVRTITGVATSITAFVGRAKSGPVNTAVRVLSFSEFARKFGSLDQKLEMSYAVHQYFLNGGSEAWIVRVAKNAQAAHTMFQRDNGDVLEVVAISQGKVGESISVEVDYETSNPDSLFNLTVTYQPPGSSTPEMVEKFPNLSMDKNATRYVGRIFKQSGLAQPSELVQVKDKLKRDSGAIIAAKGRAESAPLEDNAGRPIDVSSLLSDRANQFQVQVNSLPAVTIRLAPEDYAGADAAARLTKLCESIQTKVQASNATNDAVKDFTCEVQNRKIIMTSGVPGEDSKVETLPGIVNDASSALKLSLSSGGRQIDALASGRPVEETKHLVGGQEEDFDESLEPEHFAPAPRGGIQAREGIYALDPVDIFNLLCLPSMKDPGILDKAASYCHSRRAFLIADSPGGGEAPILPDQMEKVIAGTSFPKHKNASVFYPWVLVEGELRPPSGTIAGVFARTDSQRGVWKAPAGIDATLLGVRGVEYPLTDAENGLLNPHGVNCIRIFPVYGAVNWGARTLRGDDAMADEWKYIPVRRTALFIEESLYRGLKWVVFEPNDEPLWAQIRLNVGAFMQNLFRKGAFQGSTPREAYFVKCDKETTPQNDINLGIVNIVVGFAPLKPAEFVIIKLQQIAGQIQV